MTNDIVNGLKEENENIGDITAFKEEIKDEEEEHNISHEDITDDFKAESPVVNGCLENEQIINGIKTEENPEKKDEEELTLPDEDLIELIDNIEKNIPDNDNLAYGTRLEKMEWDKIAFKDYSAEECKRNWLLLQKRIRRYRMLHELLVDAKTWILDIKPLRKKVAKRTRKRVRRRISKKKLDQTSNNVDNPDIQNVEQNTSNVVKRKRKAKRHPEQPKRPGSAFIYYCARKRDSFVGENPTLSSAEVSKQLAALYRNLTPEKKAIYVQMAETSRKEYDAKFKIFIEKHPEFKPVTPPRPSKARRLEKPAIERPPKPVKIIKSPKDRIPKRPHTPFVCYYLAEMKNSNVPDNEKVAFKEACKEKWKDFSDKKKYYWVQVAEEGAKKYDEALKNYLVNHPDYKPRPMKPVLTKDEKQLKERIAGKPTKPPCSAYGLFSSIVLQSEEIKSVPSKERLNYVSVQWRERSDEEKQRYKDMANSMTEKYKSDFATYLETLPEEQRQQEMLNNAPKRRKSTETESESSPKKKRRRPTPRSRVRRSVRPTRRAAAITRSKSQAIKKEEPEQPPISVFKYFAKIYTGSEPVSKAFKALTPEEKHQYEEELMKKKREYITEFEKFLKSLTKDELEAYSKTRTESMQSKKDDEGDEEEEEEEDDDDDDDGEDDGEESSSGSEDSEGADESENDENS